MSKPETSMRKQQDGAQVKACLQQELYQNTDAENKEAQCVPRGTPTTSQASSADDGMSNRCKDGSSDKEHTLVQKSTVSCCLLSDLKRLTQDNDKLDPLSASHTHTVLIQVDIFNRGGEPCPREGRDKDVWNADYVKMPCSTRSVVINSTPFKKQVRRWEIIEKHLDSLAHRKSITVEDVKKTILEYNPKYKDQWAFDALHRFVKDMPKEDKCPVTLSKIAALALKLPDEIKQPIPLLKSGVPASITLSQRQIACLLANAFYCTFPHRNASNARAEYSCYPSINFSSLFGNHSDRKNEKLKAIFHYFKTVTDESVKLYGLVTFERQVLAAADRPDWGRCHRNMGNVHVTSHGSIEADGKGMLQVDFASSMIGGGVLGSGLVQEEILFIMNPELIVSRLFTERLADNECLIVKGTQQFSRYSGYSDSFKWDGSSHDDIQNPIRDKWGRLHRHILAIDALHFRHQNEQYNMQAIKRDLNKAYCGFKASGQHGPDIATGNWGCGAYNGDPQLKAVIQLMAAAASKKGMAFFTFNNNTFKKSLEEMYKVLVTNKVTVGQLYKLLEDYCAVRQHSQPPPEVFTFIRNEYHDRH